MIQKGIAHFRKILVCGLPLLALALQSAAKGGGRPPVDSSLSDPVVFTLVIIIFILLLAIILLAFVVRGAGDIYREKMKERVAERSGTTPLMMIGLLLLLLHGNYPLIAQEMVGTTAAGTLATDSPGASSLAGISPLSFYLLISVIILESLVLFALLYNLWVLIRAGREKPGKVKKAVPVRTTSLWKSVWSKLNSFKPAEQESDIVLDHDYDGIRELDNRLPPWWLYGFYLTIIVGIVYLWRHHVSHTAPDSIEEYQIAVQKADLEKQAYLKYAANNITENNVSFLGEVADLEAGKAVFTSMCAPCHGQEGQGVVGPNLTDDYWLHGGSIQDIFKVIKYGVPEKGMRSWQDDYSPRQLAQIASYVKSLHGTNPPNPKEKQGDLYTETAADAAGAADSTNRPVPAQQALNQPADAPAANTGAATQHH